MNVGQINIKWHDGVWCGKVPECQYVGDAGFDLFITRAAYINPGRFVDIEHGFDIELPHDVWGWVVGRSSTLRDRALLVNHAVIDAGYRGPMFTGVRNLGTEPVMLQVGQRISQLIPMPLVAAELKVQVVSELASSHRGAAGFGSSGR